MPMYIYKGYQASTGANTKGKVEADSERGARAKLKRDKIIVASIKEEKSSATKKETESVLGKLLGPRVSTKELSVMVRQFSVLQGAHVPLDESLKALVNQVENPELRRTLAKVKDLVSEGVSLGDASNRFPGVFNRLYVNMVRAGESSGNLGAVLTRLADFLEYQVRVGQQIISAVTYPAIMITASLSLVFYLFISVVPNLAKVFSNLKVSLPSYTIALIEISAFLREYWLLVIGGGVVAFIAFKSWVNSESGRKKMDAFVLKIPLFGPILIRIAISRFTKTLSTLLRSGVPIVRSLEITKNVVTNSVIAGVIEQAKNEVQEGKSLAVCIDRSGKFPGLVTHMIATGEKTGQLEEMLGHVSDAYESEVQAKISTMITLIEPLMMIVMFGIAGMVVGAMMLPMLDVMTQVRK